ncbi:unnamed protein product [Spirodela intermedia]|uniref:Uncharacterized protein n=1 Tax=Spirodela intermedia TaxID=51605 RepID=A0A7I8KR17_SPIIN|nr:unnamed protein product [Spirodela intermedia]
MSFGMMVTRFAWMAHRLVAETAELWKRRSVLKSWAISRTKRWKGSLRISSSVLFWYLRISLSATVPGRNLCGFFTPPVAGADFLAALVASCFLGAFPPVDFLAVCLVLAISEGGRFAAAKTREGEGITLSSWDPGTYEIVVFIDRRGREFENF